MSPRVPARARRGSRRAVEEFAEEIIDDLEMNGRIGSTEAVTLRVAVGALPVSAFRAEIAAAQSYVGGAS